MNTAENHSEMTEQTDYPCCGPSLCPERLVAGCGKTELSFRRPVVELEDVMVFGCCSIDNWLSFVPDFIYSELS